MKPIFLSLLFLFPLAYYGKDINVKVRVTNLTSDVAKAYVEVANKHGDRTGDVVFSIELESEGDYFDTTIVVEKYSMLIGYGVLKDGGRTKGRPQLVKKNNERYRYSITIEERDKHNVTDLTGEKILDYDPTRFHDNDRSPKNIEGLYSNYLGGLSVYLTVNGKDSAISTIYPYELDNVSDLITTGTGYKSKEIFIHKQNLQDIKGSIPLAVDLGVTWSSSSTYHIKMEYKDLGVIDYRINDSDESLEEKFKGLSTDVHESLGRLYEKHPDLKVRLIDRAYVFDGIFIEVKVGSKMSIENEIDGSTIFTNKGNYSFNSLDHGKQVYGSSYLGYWCSNGSRDLTPKVISKSYPVYLASKIISLNAKEPDEILSSYQEARLTNPNLPNYTTAEDISKFYREKLSRQLSQNPTVQGQDILLALDTISVEEEPAMFEERFPWNGNPLSSSEEETVTNPDDNWNTELYRRAIMNNRRRLQDSSYIELNSESHQIILRNNLLNKILEIDSE